MPQKPFEWPDYACPKGELEQQLVVRRCINAGGQSTCLFVCGHCGHRTQHFVSVKSVKRAGLESLDIEATTPLPACAVCGVRGAERHHWAPSALFGNESERWPTSFLCQRCHSRWHQKVTPRIRCKD